MNLSISLNNRCDLACSFCSQRERLDSGDFTTISPLRVTAILQSVADPLTDIALFGGEALLDLPLLKNIVSLIKKSHHHAARIILITNGIGLDMQVAEWANANKMMVNISIDGTQKSQRSVEQLFYKSTSGAAIFDVIGALNSFTIKRVISNPFENWAMDVRTMKLLFPNVKKIVLAHDKWKLAELNIQHLAHFTRQLLMLRQIWPDYPKYIEFYEFWKGDICNCADHLYAYPSGEVENFADFNGRDASQDNAPFDGCSAKANAMGRENFDTWRNTLTAMVDAARADIQ